MSRLQSCIHNLALQSTEAKAIAISLSQITSVTTNRRRDLSKVLQHLELAVSALSAAVGYLGDE